MTQAFQLFDEPHDDTAIRERFVGCSDAASRVRRLLAIAYGVAEHDVVFTHDGKNVAIRVPDPFHDDPDRATWIRFPIRLERRAHDEVPR